RFVECTDSAERTRELMVRLGAVRCQTDRVAEARGGCGEIALLQPLEAGVDGERRRLRVGLQLVEPLGFRERGRAACRIAGRVQHLREARMRFGRRWVEANRLPEFLARLVEIAALF